MFKLSHFGVRTLERLRPQMDCNRFSFYISEPLAMTSCSASVSPAAPTSPLDAPVLQRRSPCPARIFQRMSTQTCVARRPRYISAESPHTKSANQIGWKHDELPSSMLREPESLAESGSGAKGQFHPPHALRSAPGCHCCPPRIEICAETEANSMLLGW